MESSPIAKRSTILILFCLLCVGITKQGSGQDLLLTYNHSERPPTMDEMLEWKEEFTYKVKYGFFKLGQVKTQIVRDTTYRGHHLWWLRTIITSNSSIPFIGEEENHYNTLFVATDSLPHTKLYWRDNVEEEEFNDERYRFDYENEKVYASAKGAAVDTFKVTEPSSSGQLIFYYSRLFAGRNEEYQLPVYIQQQKGYITARATSRMETREYEAFKKPVETYFTKGNADFEGPFGFTGEFKSWYVTDDLRVPAEAHVKVWLGNVKVRLINYKKERRNQ
ncbi:hypothetical protein LX73_0134 [Fodinibius salinus]|uniref:DUF3108 domain-containing protein n=1 Tax=Fodinibius salinus TaxID=860790 RepID=A0A5D3YL23_9BACT|nr:DUF3108 domain-containing protein [Fodinibius salinus]TYP94845.1 hypothetical protein LX73_0134 [Fodinibius salinus]